MASVNRASERHGIDAQITKDIKDALGPLAPELEKAQNNFENVRSICDLYDKDLNSKLGSLEVEIKKKISGMGV